MVYTSFMLCVESLVFSSLSNEEVEHVGYLEEKVILLDVHVTSPLHSDMGKLDQTQNSDELFGDPICDAGGFSETGQMFFSFLTLCTNWFKHLQSQSPFSVPNCRVNGQEYGWVPNTEAATPTPT